MKRLKLFFACLLMAVLSIGQVWADDATDVVAMKGFAGLTASGYQNQTKTGESENGIDMVAYGFNASTGQVRGNKTTIAGASVTSDDANKNWSLYNSEAMPGAISKIEVTQTATGTNKFQNTLYVSLGTASQGNVTVITSAQAQDNTSDEQKITFTIDATKNYKFFKLLSTAKFTGGSVADVKVTITYDDGQGGGGDKPVVSFSPVAGKYTTAQSVTLTSEDADHIYYTTDGSTPTTSSATYSAAIPVNATTTINAFAVKGEVTGDVASATYTFPYTSIEQVLTGLDNSETSFYFTMTDWIVTAVDGKNAYITDGTEHGILAYNNSLGFVAGNILNGTVDNIAGTKFLRSGYTVAIPEFTNLTSNTSGIEKEGGVIPTGGTPTVYPKNIGDLSVTNQGIVVKLENVEYNAEDEVLSDGTNSIKVANTLYSELSLTDGSTYNITGVYTYDTYNVARIWPRSSSDVVPVGGPVIVKTLESIAITGYSTEFEQGDVFSFDGTCTATYSVTQDDVPQPDEQKVVTPTSVTSPEMSTLGSKEITVSYTEDEVTKTAKYTINVVAPTVYKKVTSAPADWSGEYLLVYETTVSEVATAYVWTGVEAINCYATTPISSSNTITKPAGAVKLTVTALTGDDEGKYSIMVNGGTNNGKYIYGTSGSNGVSFGDVEDPNTIELSSGAALITSNTSFMQYNSTSGQDRFRYYKSGTTSQKDVQLYRKAVSSEVTITNPANGTVSVLNGEAAVSTGASITEGTVLTASIADVTGYRFTLKAFKTGDESTVVDIDAEGKLTMPDYPITITADELALFAVSVAVNDNTMGSATINGGTAPIYVDDDDIITLVATPASGHEFVNWTVSDGAIALDDEDEASTTALAGVSGTITANFKVQTCTNLDAPTLDAVTKDYQSATIAWLAVANAEGYVLNLTQGATPVVTDAIITEGVSYNASGLAANTTYHYTVMAVGNGTAYCAEGNPLLEGNFTTADYPAATLSLIENDGTPYSWGTDLKMNDVIALPSTLTGLGCSGKVLAGWSSVAVEETDTKPASNYWDAGADYTLGAGAQTLYAVFGTQIGGGASNVTLDVKEYAEANGWVNGEAYNATVDGISFTYGGGGNNGKYYSSDNSWRFYNGGSLAISGTGITGVSSTPSCDFTESAGTYTCDFTATVKITKIIVSVSTPVICEGYTTSCTPAKPQVATPVISGVTNNETYTTAQTITLTCETEGAAIYYSLDGADAVAYTDPFSVGTYGAHTLTAYATKTDYDNSDEASVSFTLNLPFASLEDLVAAELADPTNVTVSFSNVVIKDIYYYPNNSSEDNRKGLVFDIQKGGQDIKIYYNAKVPTEWVAGGKVSGTLTDCPWKTYSGAWQLAPASGFAWATDLSYTAPKAVSSVVVSGTPDKTTYVDGEKFKPAGLTVTVNYNDATSEVNPTGVTFACSPERVAKSDDPVSVSVVATFNEISSEAYAVNVTVGDIQKKTVQEFITAGNADMRCYLEGIVSDIETGTKLKYGNFNLTDASGTIYVYGCLNQAGEAQKFDELGVQNGDKIKVIAEDYDYYNKHEAKNVQFVSKTPAATIDIDDINMTVGDEIALSSIVATITPVEAESATINYEVTEGTAVTISEGKIIASTEGEATITASIAAGEGYLAGSTTFTVTVSAAPTPFVGDYFVKVDDNSKLTAGEYLIVYEDGNLAFNGGLTTLDAVSNTVAVTFENDKIQGTDDVLAATFTVKLAGGTIQSKSGYYIGRTGNSNGLNSSTEEAYTNTISIDENGDAVILASGGAYLRYNSASGQERFRYFQSSSYTGQKAIQLYKKENAEPDYETVRTGLNVNAYYTMCLEKAVADVRGGSIWRVVSKAANGTDIILEDVACPLDAGRPYIFLSTAENLEVVYDGAAVGAPITEGNNGLIGSFVKAQIAKDASNYIIYNNMLYYVNSNNVFVGDHRAYLDMSDVPNYNGGAAAPGRRRITMGVHGEQTATGIDALNASETPVKMIIDGKMYILRGEKMYDATGRLVK